MSKREEMRRLINVIERGVMSASFEQNVEALKLFANTASFIANKLEVKLKQNRGKTKARRIAPNVPKLPVPKPNTAGNRSKPTTATNEPALPTASSTATSSMDFERLRSVSPQQPVTPNSTVGTIG